MKCYICIFAGLGNWVSLNDAEKCDQCWVFVFHWHFIVLQADLEILVNFQVFHRDTSINSSKTYKYIHTYSDKSRIHACEKVYSVYLYLLANALPKETCIMFNSST